MYDPKEILIFHPEDRPLFEAAFVRDGGVIGGRGWLAALVSDSAGLALHSGIPAIADRAHERGKLTWIRGDSIRQFTLEPADARAPTSPEPIEPASPASPDAGA